jgi:hypothetical protein
MPVKMRVHKIKGKTVYDVVEPSGKLVKRHSSRAKAVAHVQGRNIGEMRSEGRKDAPPKPRKKKRK